MKTEISGGSGLIPIERVAVPQLETTDKATRKMIAQMQTTLLPRFQIEFDGSALEYNSMRFATLKNGKQDTPALRAALRVTEKNLQLSADAPLEIISGMCLFGASGLTGITKSGKRMSLTNPYELRAAGTEAIVQIQELPTLHPSEAEAVARITKALTLLQQSDTGTGEVRVTFHLPIPEYKIYMLSLLRKGVINQNQLQELNAKIDRRANALMSLVQKRVDLPMSVGSPLDVLNPLLSQTDTPATVANCVAVLQRQPLLSTALALQSPVDFFDLTNLSYSAAYLSVAKQAQAQGGNCLAVEIAEEVPIFEYAKKLAGQMGAPLSMAALYIPSSTVSLSGKDGKEALFMHEPNGSSPLSQLRTIVKNNQERNRV